MHELGIIIQVVESIEKIYKEQNLTEIDTLVLEVGEGSGMVPHYIEEVYPIAIEQSFLKNMKLKLEVVPAIGICECGHTYNLMEHEGLCPKCGSHKFEVIGGREFKIKQIIAY